MVIADGGPGEAPPGGPTLPGEVQAYLPKPPNPCYCGLFGIDRSAKPMQENRPMAKPKRKINAANHGKRPACSKVRKQKRHRVKT